MFGFIRKVFIETMIFLSFNVLNVNSLECVSVSDQECKARPKIIDVNANEPVFYPFSIKVNKCLEVVIISMIHMLICAFQILLNE